VPTGLTLKLLTPVVISVFERQTGIKNHALPRSYLGPLSEHDKEWFRQEFESALTMICAKNSFDAFCVSVQHGDADGVRVQLQPRTDERTNKYVDQVRAFETLMSTASARS